MSWPFWHVFNTECSTWFERDRAMVRLTTRGTDLEIICLWDAHVADFVEDGFKTQSQSWHEALCEYANNHKIIPEVE
jgi:hypothetical protein